jgi:mercuric ion binding protein
MKTIQILSIIVACLTMSFAASSQKVRTESFTVSGECGMCKKKIESAAKQGGAIEASWSPQTKVVTVTYNAGNGSAGNIKQAIANVGYDTPGYRAPDDAYNSLDKCCQYKREVRTAQCCAGKEAATDEKCAAMPACKDKDCCKKS